ncbi:cytotoxic and regulatory T-cell molecule [Spea bombifrons]|uniref:cytotoxic and regulatory T-cell molecule n=1 Tax=Spea bombifrons TaxID=233779 RepID=UPI00234AD406|nr:cytotoxic and regulatory T-cell molecule [Spea bombifrons]
MICTVRDSLMHALLLLSGLVTFSAPVKCDVPRVSVAEGGAVTLRCVFPGGDGSAMQWVTPAGFAIFFNDQRVLRDRRFQIVRHLKNNLILRLADATIADEGIYTCIQYSSPARTRRVNVSVLAVPSKPLLDFSQIPGRNGEFYSVLTCFTFGCKPPPEITWLIDNSTEVFGETELSFEDNGKKCNATSSLRIRAASSSSRATCILRHDALRRGDLTAAFVFRAPPAETQTTTPITTATSPRAASPSSSQDTLLYTEISPGTDFSLTPDKETTGRSNETQRVPPAAEAGRRSGGVLVLVLVALMVCVLLVIVHFFLVKLRKQHTEWKKENEISDQTLESTKSRSNNDDVSNQTKPGQAPMEYNKEISV